MTLRYVSKRLLNITRAFDKFAISGYVIAMAIVVWLTWDIWSPGPPVGDDTVAHLIRADYAINRFLLDARLDGWQPTFALGYQQHLFIGPVLTWVIALVQALSFGTISTLVAFKIVIVLLFAALPLSIGYLARSFGLSLLASSVAAILSLLVNSPYGGFGVRGLFGIGLIANLPGAVVLCIALGTLLRLFREPTRKRALMAGIFFALLAATHGISLILATALVAVLFFLMIIEGAVGSWAFRSELRRYLPLVEKYCDDADVTGSLPVSFRSSLHLSKWVFFSAITAIGLAAWIVFPILVHYDLRGVLTGWGHTPLLTRLFDVWGGHILFERTVSFAVAAGLVYGLWRVICGRQMAFTLVISPFAFLALGEAFHFFSPESVISHQIPNRGLGLAGVLAILPLSALITTITRPARQLRNVLSVAIAAVFVVVHIDELRPEVRTVAPTPVGYLAAAELKTLVPDGARYAMQRDFPDEIRIVGMSHPDFWMAWQSNRNTLNVFNVESSTTPTPAYTPDHMTKNQPPDLVADKLSRYGVTHVLLVNTAKATALLSSSRFNLVWQHAPMAILSVMPQKGRPEPASLLSTDCESQARLIDSDPEHLRISVQLTSPCNATIAVAWSPKWRAHLNGKPVTLSRNNEGLLSVPLDAGDYIISLDFQLDGWDRFSIATSVLTLFLVLGYLWRK